MYTCVCVYVCRRLGGESDLTRRPSPPGNRFRFRDRVARAVRARGRGEAAWAGERKASGDWAATGPHVAPPAAGGPRCPA
eukprot:1375741-Pyramimonas_sp.AAC.1